MEALTKKRKKKLQTAKNKGKRYDDRMERKGCLERKEKRKRIGKINRTKRTKRTKGNKGRNRRGEKKCEVW